MLHSIDESGNIVWDCHNPACPHHHCAGRDDHCVCPHHEEKVKGQPHQAHISHEEVQYTSPRIVALPACKSCKSRMFVAVDFTPQELIPPIIERDEQGHILSVTRNGAPNFTVVRDHVELRLVEVDDTVSEGMPLIRQNGKLYQVFSDYIIDDAYVAPWLERHLSLHRQLQAIGKPVPQPIIPQEEPKWTLERVREFFNNMGIPVIESDASSKPNP